MLYLLVLAEGEGNKLSRESITLFLVFFLITFAFVSAIVISGTYEAPTEGITFLGTIGNIIDAFKKFHIDIPIFGTLIITIITALIAYVLYREARGGI